MNYLGLWWVKALAIGVVLVAVFGAGARVDNWHMTARLEKLKAEDADAAVKTANEALAEQTRRYAAHLAEVQKVAAIDKAELAKLKGAQDENDRLRACVRNGTCGLRIHASCPVSAPGSVPTPSASPGVDTGTSPGLDATAEWNYFALRDGIIKFQAALAACQATLKTITGQ